MKTALLQNFVSLLFPVVCAGCGTLLYRDEKTVCMSCRYLLPYTAYEKVPDNPVARIFWGRIRLEGVMACFFFSKQGKVQNLVHELKYKRNREAGHFLGLETGKALLQSDWHHDLDYIVPVPLHPKRERKRGYNQSEILAKGIQEATRLPVISNKLVRATASETQTKKSRTDRWENVKSIFALRDKEQFAGKHVLLVDDVITTGSTLEACALCLQQAEDIRISIAATACAPL